MYLLSSSNPIPLFTWVKAKKDQSDENFNLSLNLDALWPLD